jgi:hypothetical protein
VDLQNKVLRKPIELFFTFDNLRALLAIFGHWLERKMMANVSR